MASDHVRGEMDITEHKSTFDGFMTMTVWSCLLTIVILLFFILVFAIGMNWMGALIATGVVGVVLGLALSMKTSWYVTVAGLFVSGLIGGGIVSLFGAFLAG
ncbi:aa3-type cytochrome c oxidase subunit IV [Maricaulis sp.]|uniref:aa3-type cytochrome c oxidase subunit IV n=1 Tax=Maricaulis sp. TaxID=1486257 RepID=UPI001B01586B|nr:aa3-type cytochrome c oxidase subunit IV [Maricaulis sp.]MBO6797439.1 aa3-type cytochrome c oxidase subunit IV [Maricaulis sp.]